MLRYIGIIALSISLLGCGIRSPRRGGMAGETYGAGGQLVGSGGQAGGPTASQISTDPRTALNQVDQHLQQQGYRRMGPAVRNASFAQGQLIAYPIEAAAEMCYTVVAIAAPTTDLNLFVIDPAGRTIAANVDPDPHPWTTVCPGVTGRVVARLQMVAGSGEYYYAVYQGRPNVQPSLAALFGAPAVQQVQQAQIDGTTSQRVAALDARLRSQNLTRVGEPRGEVFGTGEDRDYQLNLTQGTCYAFATFGGPGASDTDAFLVDGSGSELVRDVSTNVDAVLEYCAPATGAYRLRARMYRGQGPLFTAVYARGQAPAATQAPVIAATSTSGAGIDENFRLLDSDMRARGYEPLGSSQRGQLAQGATQDFSIEVEGGKCYAILAVGDSGVRDLDLVLSDSSGTQVDRDVEQDPRPIVRVCARSSGTYRMQVRMYNGQGNFVYATYRWPRGTSGPFGLSGIIYVRLAEVTSLLAVEGYEPDVDEAPGNGRFARANQSRSHNIQLQAGQCYSVLVVGGQGVNDVDVTLKKGGTDLTSDGSRNAFPSVRHCATESGRYTIDVRAADGAGEYFYQIFRRSAS